MDPKKSLKGREDMGQPTSKVQGRGDLTEWAGCPCKKDINCETGVNSLEQRGEIAMEFLVLIWELWSSL